MTPEEKIAELVEHIKKEFSEGCEGIPCTDCPVSGYGNETVENSVCKLLETIAIWQHFERSTE